MLCPAANKPKPLPALLAGSLAAFVFCLSVTPLLTARGVEAWPYERLFKEADLVIIATAAGTKDSNDTFIDERWPLEFVGQNTKFDVNQFLKGSPPKEVAVLHFKFGKVHKKAQLANRKEVEIIDGPSFLQFGSKPQTFTLNGIEYNSHKIEYLLFLKKRDDGRFEPVSGRIDPDLSVRELFPPAFSVKH
jgi:hypothetical protein